MAAFRDHRDQRCPFIYIYYLRSYRFHNYYLRDALSNTNYSIGMYNNAVNLIP